MENLNQYGQFWNYLLQIKVKLGIRTDLKLYNKNIESPKDII